MGSQDRPALSLVMLVTLPRESLWSEHGLSERHNWPISHPGLSHLRMSLLPFLHIRIPSWQVLFQRPYDIQLLPTNPITKACPRLREV